MWSALVLGLLGSIHCLAMCGPLVLTLNSKRRQSSFDRLLYNSGRVFTYTLLGVLAGLFGSGIEWAAGQQFLSVFSGLLLLIGLTVSWMGANSHRPWSRILVKVKTQMSNMLKTGTGGHWWFGMYNGLLPCGLTYVALAAAVSLGSLSDAVIYMALFGIGTSPMMYLIVVGFQKLKLKSTYGNKLITGFTWVLALLLIIRGLGLGIPYVSPDPNQNHETHMSTDQ
jgi:sulfite exporter TauE/SafE